MLANAIAQPVRVDLRMLGERSRHGLQQDVVHRHLELVAQLRHRGAHLGHTLEIEFRREIERGNRADGLGQPLRDGLSNLREGDVLIVAGDAHAGRGTRRGGRRGGGLDVAFDDAAAGPGALNSSELDSLLGSKSARER